MVLNFPVQRTCLSTTMTFASTSTTCSWKDCCKPFPMNRLNPGRSPGCSLASERTSRQTDSTRQWAPRCFGIRHSQGGREARRLVPFCQKLGRVGGSRSGSGYHVAGPSPAEDGNVACANRCRLRTLVGQALRRIDQSASGATGHAPSHPASSRTHVNEVREHKAALVLIDGLALHQWIVIRQELVKQRPGVRFRENAVFAWIPTITSVSRQAAFAGKPPIYFPNSIHTTDKEPALWTQFWRTKGCHSRRLPTSRDWETVLG